MLLLAQFCNPLCIVWKSQQLVPQDTRQQYSAAHPPDCCLSVQVVRMSPAEVFNVRQQVAALQERLNKRAFAVLQAFMPLVEDIPQAPAVG